MINIIYTDVIKVESGNLNASFSSDQLPLNVNIKNSVSKEIIWSTPMTSFMWVTFPNSEMIDVVITDFKGDFVYQYYWDVMIHGSVFYKAIWFYCKSLINRGINPNGLAIGTHDGEFGEWCPLVKYNLSNITLVEASEKQFSKLKKNYGNKSGIKLVNELITPNGVDVEFFEGGRGYTNSIVERVIKSWETEQISSTQRKSLAINNLISEHCGKLDWIHLDVEGLDAQLLFAIEENNLPNFIIFEDNNLLLDEKMNLMDYLTKKGYISECTNGICMSTKKQ